MGELTNCPNCGRLFVRGIRNVCESCRQEVEKQFEDVYTYIRQKHNREAKLMEVSQATGVKEKTIIQFIREGRLRVSEFPNLAYPCESCGETIQKGKICASCRERIQKGLDFHQRQEEFERKRKESERAQTYYSNN